MVFFQPEGVDAQAGGRADGATLQAALAAAVVAVPGLAGAGNLPFDQLVERVVGEGGRLAVVRAAREVAPGVVPGTVGRGAGVGAERTRRISWRACDAAEPAGFLDNLYLLPGLPKYLWTLYFRAKATRPGHRRTNQRTLGKLAPLLVSEQIRMSRPASKLLLFVTYTISLNM